MTLNALPAEQMHRPAATAMPFAPASAPTYALLATAIAALPLALKFSGLTLAINQFALIALIAVFLVWLALCLRGRGFHRAATLIEGFVVFNAVCMTGILYTFAAGTHLVPFADDALARADKTLLPGFDWPGAMIAFSRSGWPARVANIVYESIRWQPQLLIAALAWQARHKDAWTFLLAWTLTLAICIAVFALWPALGAYTHFAIAPGAVPAMRDPTPWHQPQLLEALRSGQLRHVGLAQFDGIVQFPSFHAAAAVLLAAGFWNAGRLRWPFVLVNAAMAASAVPVGGHYVIDLAAGAIAAALGLRMAAFIMRVRADRASSNRAGLLPHPDSRTILPMRNRAT